MQFQPYKGGGGPDFLSLALRIRQQRTQEESQKRRDEAALIRAQSQAENDELARQARRLELAEKYSGNLSDIAGLSRAVGEGQAAVEGAVDQFAPFSQVDTQTALDPAKADDAFGAIAEQLTARGAFENQLQPLEQALQTQIARQARLLKAARPELTDEQALGIAQRDVSASVFSQQAGEGRELSKTLADESRAEQAQIRQEGRAESAQIRQEGRAEEAQKRSEGRAAERDLPQRQARIDERIAGMTDEASVAYRASRNPKLTSAQQEKAQAQLNAQVDALVPEYAAAYNVTPEQARRIIMAPIEGSPIAIAQEMQESGADIAAKDIAEAESAVGVIRYLNGERRRLNALRSEAEDPQRIAEIDDHLDAVNQERKKLVETEGERTISSGDLVKASRGYLSAVNGMEDTAKLRGLVKSGQIKTGPVGFITSLGLRFTEIANDVMTDPTVPDETKDVFRQMQQSADGTITVGGFIDRLTGKQLNLSADQLFLAWEIVKAKRESARFTLLELQSTLELVDFTDPFKPKAQFVEMLDKVIRTQTQAAGISASILRMAGQDPALELARYRQEKADLENLLGDPAANAGSGGGDAVNRSATGASAGNATNTPAPDPIPGSDEYAAEMARRIANGTYVGGGQ